MRTRETRDNKELRPQRKRRKKVCVYCAEKTHPDYKKLDQIRRFVSDRGKILPLRNTGCCAKHQRSVAAQIKRARQVGLLPYVLD